MFSFSLVLYLERVFLIILHPPPPFSLSTGKVKSIWPKKKGIGGSGTTRTCSHRFFIHFQVRNWRILSFIFSHFSDNKINRNWGRHHLHLFIPSFPHATQRKPQQGEHVLSFLLLFDSVCATVKKKFNLFSSLICICLTNSRRRRVGIVKRGAATRVRLLRDRNKDVCRLLRKCWLPFSLSQVRAPVPPPFSSLSAGHQPLLLLLYCCDCWQAAVGLSFSMPNWCCCCW